MKKGLVMEGGAMRGIFTAGVTDVFMENGVTFDGAIGTSAGACFGCNIKSGQVGRTLRYNKKFCTNPRYIDYKNLILKGEIFSKEFCYDELPKSLDLFDFEAFNDNPMEFYITCTDIMTGGPVYHKCTREDSIDDLLEWIRASAAMPMVQGIVDIGGYKLLDGGVADSVPLKHFEEIGYDRNVVILTQPIDYVKRKIKYGLAASIKYRKYPNLVREMKNRHIRYNEMTEYIKDREQSGDVFVIRPDESLHISITRDEDKIQSVYNAGRRIGERELEKVKIFLSK